jgi:peptidyl-prolyl cis-trans isomerase SurA
MQRQVWTPAQTDTLALLAYFEKNKKNYNWKESADAVLFYAADAGAAKEFYNALLKKPSNWRTVLPEFAEKITVDSNRFELAQLPTGGKGPLTKGMLSTPVFNKENNTTFFAYVLQLYPKPAPRNFAQAKGLVINDYQAQLEKDWVEELRKKYPVTIDEKVWTAVVKKAGVR